MTSQKAKVKSQKSKVKSQKSKHSFVITFFTAENTPSLKLHRAKNGNKEIAQKFWIEYTTYRLPVFPALHLL